MAGPYDRTAGYVPAFERQRNRPPAHNRRLPRGARSWRGNGDSSRSGGRPWRLRRGVRPGRTVRVRRRVGPLVSGFAERLARLRDRPAVDPSPWVPGIRPRGAGTRGGIGSAPAPRAPSCSAPAALMRQPCPSGSSLPTPSGRHWPTCCTSGSQDSSHGWPDSFRASWQGYAHRWTRGRWCTGELSEKHHEPSSVHGSKPYTVSSPVWEATYTLPFATSGGLNFAAVARTSRGPFAWLLL